MLELTAERSVLDVVNRAMENSIRFQNSHAAAMSAEVRMVVGSVEKVANTIFFGNNTTKAAHIRLLDEKDFPLTKIEILSRMQRLGHEKIFL